MCDSTDKNIPLMKPTFFSEDDVDNPKNKKNKKVKQEEKEDQGNQK